MRSPASTPGRTRAPLRLGAGEDDRVRAEALHREDGVGERRDLAERLAHEDERADVDVVACSGLPTAAPPCASGTR